MTNLKQQIQNKGLKLSWIAEQIGISRPLLTMYLNGKRKISKEVESKIIDFIK